MKPIYPYALMGALFAVGVATAATTTPVGYTTETLKSGQFNLIGVSLHNPVVSAGVIDAESSNSLTDTGVDFSALLSSGATYVLELENGTIQEITSWNASGQLTTPDDVTGHVTPGATTYKLRKATTVADIFGSSNSAGLQGTDAFDPTQADLIYVPTSSGFNQYFYSSAEGATGWYNVFSFEDGANDPVIYTDGILVLRRAGGDIPLVITGEVKTKPTTVVLAGDGAFNYVGVPYPVGATLGNSNIGAQLQGTDAFDPTQADLIYVPTESGYSTYFYSTAEGAVGWYDVSTFEASDSQPLTSGILVLRRGTQLGAVVSAPAEYSSL